MRIASRICLVGLLMLVAMSMAAAPGTAGPAASPTEPPAQQPAAAEPTDDGQGIVLKSDGLETILGREVKTATERDAGRIIDVLADHNGQVRAVVIEFGGFLGIGTRKIAVEWSALHYDNAAGRPLWLVDVSRDQLRAAPDYKPSAPAVVPRASN